MMDVASTFSNMDVVLVERYSLDSSEVEWMATEASWNETWCL